MAQEIILILTPIAVYIATAIAKYILPRVPGWVIVSIIVPAISFVFAGLTSLLGMIGGFWIQVVTGLLAVFVNELIKQLRQGND